MSGSTKYLVAVYCKSVSCGDVTVADQPYSCEEMGTGKT